MKDWTHGDAGIVFQQCCACHSIWYFERTFCPRCGTAGPQSPAASGRGRVYAITTVSRAPSPELGAPYRVALVDMEEGFRAMTHAADDVAIDDPVRTRFVSFGTLTIPFCERLGDEV